MRCPHCNSAEVDKSNDQDCTEINRFECVHAFDCHDCGCIFTITYQAFESHVVEDGDSEE